MVMSVHMQDRDRFSVGDLENPAERATANTGPNVGIFDVILVRYGVPSFSREQQSRVGKRRRAAGEKANPLAGKGMTSGEVLMDLHEEETKQSQSDDHRRILACSAKMRIQG